MIYITDTKQTLKLEQKALVEQNLTVERLMDKAGKSLAQEVLNYHPKGLVAVVCGKGNNGGDGFVAANYLVQKGMNVKVIALYGQNEMSKVALKFLKKLPSSIIKKVIDSQKILNNAEIIVDAIFGFSFKPPIREHELKIIEKINKQRKIVVSADLPSGIEASTGFAREEKVVIASKTVCFTSIKKGLLTDKGPLYAGKIRVADLGIKEEIAKNLQEAVAFEADDIIRLLPKRTSLSHKKTMGKVLVVSGSSSFTGAPIMTSSACYRAGAGYVTLAVPRSEKPVIQAKITPEVIVEGFGNNTEGIFSKEDALEIAKKADEFDCVAIGPGLTSNQCVLDFVESFLEQVKKPVVIDADGLSAIARNIKLLKKIKTEIILTPHAGELARITNLSLEKIENDRFGAAKILRKKNIVVVLKGRYTIIDMENKGAAVNLTSNPGMATAGSGDVLTGITAAFVAQGLKMYDAAVAGVYVHGLAGDIAAREISEYALIATDLIDYLPEAFKALISNYQLSED